MASIASPQHALYCFDVLHHRLTSPKSAPPVASFARGEEPYAVFVTYETLREGRDPRLRGCIGNFRPQPLEKQLQEYAIVAALEDHRFNPITAKELPTLQCEVSILTPFEPCSNPFDWAVGTHGIYLTFSNPSNPSSRKLTATYLPHVMTEQGWNKEEALQSAIEKAGYRPNVRLSDLKDLVVQKYRSEKVGVRYDEWKESRGM